MTVEVWARRLTTGRPKPPVPPFRSGVPMRGACRLPSWTGHLDGVGVRGQLQCAAAPAVVQGVGDELGHDQDNCVPCVRGHGRLPQPFEESSCRMACVGNGRCGTDGCGAGNHRDHQGDPGLWIVHALPVPAQPCAPPLHPPTPQSHGGCLKGTEDHSRRMTAPAAVIPCFHPGTRVHTSTSCSIIPGSSRAAQTLVPRPSTADLLGVTAGSVRPGRWCSSRDAVLAGCPPTVAAAQSATSRSARRAALEPPMDRSRRLPHLRAHGNLCQPE